MQAALCRTANILAVVVSVSIGKFSVAPILKGKVVTTLDPKLSGGWKA